MRNKTKNKVSLGYSECKIDFEKFPTHSYITITRSWEILNLKIKNEDIQWIIKSLDEIYE